jgi:arginyl-tRNA synthetase
MESKIQALVVVAVQKVFNLEPIVKLDIPDEQFGDFATNIAMQLAPVLGEPPREIAQQIVAELEKSPEIVQAGVAGPGFINMTLADEILMDAMDSQPQKTLSGLKYLVEYSDPNPFKPLHAGHLYTTLVGDVLARLVEGAGAETIRLNYGGDVGRHVGISMWAIMKKLGEQPLVALEEISEAALPEWMGQCYVEGTTAFEDDESAKEEIIAINKRVYALHESDEHDSEFAQVYWKLRDASYNYFKKLYVEMKVKAFDRFIPESEVTQLGIKTVKQQLKKGVFTESENAVVFDGEQYGLHTRVFINSQGLPTYETKDIGLSLTKWQDYHFDQSIIITANEQSQYMTVVIKALEQFAPEPATRTKHLTHGVVKLSGGIKMSSRKGNILNAFEILEAARVAGKSSGQAVDESVVLAAVKYALLKSRIGGDIIYEPAESVATEGNSGPYLQYAHARACSILNKADSKSIAPETLEAGERTLVRKLGEFTPVIERATLELAPHNICTYLYELAQTFNRFYENNRVIGNERAAHRLHLIEKYATTLKNGLELLGIEAPEKM